MKFSACIEMLFVPESGNPAERIRLAAAQGFDTVEFWWWTNKDLDAIETTCRETGIRIAGMVAEPMISLVDPSNHARFLKELPESIAVAKRLGIGVLIAQAGNERADVRREEQRAALVTVLKQAADLLSGTGVRIALEPLNTLVDHAGYFLSSTQEALDIIDEIDRPEIRITYDIYHSMVMGETPSEVVNGRVDRIAHVHIADHAGRNQPGTGRLDLRSAVSWLLANGYAGVIGLEFVPTGSTADAIAETKAYFAA